MREIKYRGLNTKGEWVYGSLVNTTHGIATMPHTRTKTWIVESAFGNGGWFNVTRKQYVKPETVGQFIGRKDRDGVDVYDGDILEIRFFDDFSNDCVTVEHEESDPSIYTAKVHWDCAGYWLFSEKDATWFFPQSLDDCANIKVIGNIHENPELMEQKQ